ncbi:MAG: D-tyrosyl-tRNA(Tyr) deacylase [Lachnospiraceae bacterium]|nr:D-tyrosyl-tRNA(Tyr) deacylase [Lachnospiraceae bacterium]
MKFLIQRVNKASVSVDGKITGSIKKGFLVLIGIGKEDTNDDADRMVRKMIGLRIFADENGKTNLSIKDIGGELLLVSQFTLYADCRKGNRPSFVKAAGPDIAEKLYQYIIEKCKEEITVVEKGIFGADMSVVLENDGPFTVMLDSGEL